MSSVSEIVESQIALLTTANIPYKSIHVTDDGPVVIVDVDTMRMIARKRDAGKRITGRFVSPAGDGSWMASFVDADGEHQFYDKVTECVAYRLVLGYAVGRKSREGRFRGYYPRYHIKKDRDDWC